MYLVRLHHWKGGNMLFSFLDSSIIYDYCLKSLAANLVNPIILLYVICANNCAFATESWILIG